eukprot:g21079.t1
MLVSKGFYSYTSSNHPSPGLHSVPLPVLLHGRQAGAPLYFHGYRRGRELGRGASGQVFLCHKKGTEGGGFAVKAVDLRRLHLQPNAEREEKKLSREVEILKRLPPHPNIIPIKQDELQSLVGKLKISDLAKSVVLGLLQLEPHQRLDLSGLARHEWMVEEVLEEEAEKPKRTRSTSSFQASVQVPPPKALEQRVEPPEAPPSPPPPPPPPEPPAPPPSPSGPSPTVPAMSSSKRSVSSMLSPGEVLPASLQPEVMQVHMVVPDRLAATCRADGFVWPTSISSTLGCQVRLISRKTVREQRLVGDHRIVIIGNYNQCVIVQELVHGRMMQAMRQEGEEPTGETSVMLFVRAEAAGVVIGKQGWVLGCVRKQSNARINLLREEIRGQRPCIIEGQLPNILRADAERRADGKGRPSTQTKVKCQAAPTLLAQHAPGSEFATYAFECGAAPGSWKGLIGWIQPEQPLNHPRAFSRQGQVYVHAKDVLNQEPLAIGQAVRFHLYEDRAGLGADQCGSIVVGRTDLTGNDAGSVWHTGGEASSSPIFLDQCSLSGSGGAHTASPAVVAAVYAQLVLWDCFAPSLRKGTLAAVIRAEVNSRAMVAGDGPTLGWPGWSKSRGRPEGGAAIGPGAVSWMDVSGRFVPPSTTSVRRAQRPSITPSLQNWPAVSWNTSRGRTASTVSQLSLSSDITEKTLAAGQEARAARQAEGAGPKTAVDAPDVPPDLPAED